ncbi:hypothetical protein PIB30_013489 [Stylosanthes scabra]|uniref:TIR domain-containing protein n=1 Tax=Stylosanthes scabra TaxID=79078 RepID=A0ABU6Z6U4_9FABA|nr:hypothetical protein [Stylosanthes scabra]
MASFAGSSQISPKAKTYGVFLSFRGEDTRDNFTCHLCTALVDRGIKVYRDDQLDRGGDIWAQLCGAIEDSYISVVVFSQDFASSKWCLEELVKIMDCRRVMDQVVIPVFYQVSPTNVRFQKESFNKSFAKHELNLRKDAYKHKEKVLSWRKALEEAANLSGWSSSSRGIRDDSELIQHIVKDVLKKLELRRSNLTEGLVGIEKTQKEIQSLLEKEQVIGIWGQGGIGKTIIAKVMFNKLCCQYDCVCLMENISKEAEEQGLPRLCRNLFLDLLKEDDPTHNNVASLETKKVLIVLDGVEGYDQLEYLCQRTHLLSYLREDSRLIITSRNRHVLSNIANDKIYGVKILDTKESLKLFSLKAFKNSQPKKGYEQLSNQALEYAGGIPLALHVLGSHLWNRSIEFWESTLRKLKNSPHKDIQKVLRVSYDGLDDLEKKIFLDIAFFFREENKNRVVRILDACGFEPNSGIVVLEDKALITISSFDKKIQMHDLLLEMALEIVREQSSGGRSRLRDAKEICDVIRDNTGTNAVEGIMLDTSQIDQDLHFSSDIFKKMKKIRFLKLYIPKGESSNNYLPHGLEQFPDELRYLEWHGYPLKSFPLRFCSKLLVEIHLCYSDVEVLWMEGKIAKDLSNLEVIDLSDCSKLESLPDLSNAKKLRWVNLSGCKKLRYLHPSVLSAGKLVTLLLDRCTSLIQVKSEETLESLKKISVNGCPSLMEFDVQSALIERLDLSKTAIRTLHTSIGDIKNLKSLNLEGLRLERLVNELSKLKSLEYLNLSRSGLEFDKDQLRVLFDGLKSLEKLHLKHCSNLFELPDNIHALSQLNELRLDGSSITSLPASIKNLTRLEILSLENCNNLVSVPELPPFIKDFNVNSCDSLKRVSSLRSLATKMIGKMKRILMKDCLKLENSDSIIQDLHLTMASAAFNNVLVRSFDNRLHSFNYNKVEVCLPGKSVPRQLKNRTTESSAIIIIRVPNPSSVMGFLLSVVLSPSSEAKQGIADSHIYCRCYSADGTEIGDRTTWSSAINKLNSENLFVWYDPYFYDAILKTRETHVSFEFSTDHGLGVIKDCGVRVIDASEFHGVIRGMDLEWHKKVELGVKLGLALDLQVQRQVECEVDLGNLLFALEYNWKLNKKMASEIQSRRNEMVKIILPQSVYPPRPAINTIPHGFEDILD